MLLGRQSRARQQAVPGHGWLSFCWPIFWNVAHRMFPQVCCHKVLEAVHIENIICRNRELCAWLAGFCTYSHRWWLWRKCEAGGEGLNALGATRPDSRTTRCRSLLAACMSCWQDYTCWCSKFVRSPGVSRLYSHRCTSSGKPVRRVAKFSSASVRLAPDLDIFVHYARTSSAGCRIRSHAVYDINARCAGLWACTLGAHAALIFLVYYFCRISVVWAAERFPCGSRA
jgi:hypothetical protein